MNKFRYTFTALLLMLSGWVQAQHTVYGISKSNGFLQNKMKWVLGEGDQMRFDAMRFYIHRADDTEERYTFLRADTFYLQDPGIGIYRPNYLRNNDFSDERSQYCFARSRQSEHFIIYWEAGFGEDPATAPSPYTFDPDEFLTRAEKVYDVYTQRLGFGTSEDAVALNTYKINVFVHHQDTWRATGSGVDYKAGSLDVNPAAANTTITTAHEIGHTFQYMTCCDYSDPRNHGWEYGFGPNSSGGCAWWESCAQWQAYKVYPSLQFTDGWAGYIYRYSHLNLLHEEMRYYNFYVQDYWCQLHGQDFIGRLWRESVKPEDPVEAYQRLTGTSQAEFCRDMYDYACRAITWDIDALRHNGRNATDKFTTTLHNGGEGYWEVDSANCPQNYGFNVIRLRVPVAGTTVQALFMGEAGTKGFRAINTGKAGWRYGFVALKSTGERIYAEMHDAPEGTAAFTIPENTTNLWFVVMGAPTEHWHHPWDMVTDNAGNDQHTAASIANDEQWPYRVRFVGTAILK